MRNRKVSENSSHLSYSHDSDFWVLAYCCKSLIAFIFQKWVYGFCPMALYSLGWLVLEIWWLFRWLKLWLKNLYLNLHPGLETILFSISDWMLSVGAFPYEMSCKWSWFELEEAVSCLLLVSWDLQGILVIAWDNWCEL